MMSGAGFPQAAEKILWEGKPAPRCFTYRNWRRSLRGILLLLFAAILAAVGELLDAAYANSLLAWIAFPLLLLALYLALGHLFLARLEWERVRYTLTDRRLLVARGLLRPRLLDIPLAQLDEVRLELQGEELGTLSIATTGPCSTVTLHCLEYPRQVLSLLQKAREGLPPDAGN